MRRLTGVRLALSCSCMVAPYHMVHAQTSDAAAGADSQADAQGLGGEIVVTATRQRAVLSRVPLSIAAYDAAKLDEQNVRRIDDLARLTPGINFSRAAGVNGNNTFISVRGIASGIGAATTGIYIDDTPVQSRSLGNTATNAYPLIFDLERVEVLRGPQGTLFGASAQGGTVRFITPKPSLDSYSVYGRAEVSFIDSGSANYEAGVAVGGPLVADKLGFRASAWYRHDGGWVDRIEPLTQGQTSYETIDSNINTQDATAFKLALAWQPVDWLTLTPSVYHQKQKIDDAAVFFDRVRTSAVGVTPQTYLQLSDPSAQSYRSAYSIPQEADDKFTLPALLIEADLGAVNLISNTSYFDRTLDSVGDYTYLVSQLYGSRLPYTTIAGEASPSYFTNTQDIFSQELRLQSEGGGTLNWVVGGFYTRAKQLQLQDIITPDLNQQILNRTGGAFDVRRAFGFSLLPGDNFFHTSIESVDEQLAGFAQVDYEILEDLKLTAGLRLSRTSFDTDVVRDGPLAGGRRLTNGKLTETPVTPKLGISYQYDPSTLLYASAAKGFRPGGAQAQLSPIACASDFTRLGITETPPTFGSDSLWSYEAGAKKRIGSAVQFDVSGYVIKWKGIQQNVFLTSCSGSYTANIGEVTSKGVDLSLQVRPVSNLTLGGAFGYNKATFDETVYTVPPLILRTEGSPLGGAPVTLSLSGQYDVPFGADNRAYLRVDYQYSAAGDRLLPTDFGYDPANDPRPEMNNIHARIGIKLERVDVSVFADNLTNAAPHAAFHLSTTSGLFTATAPRPRTIGVTATVRY